MARTFTFDLPDDEAPLLEAAASECGMTVEEFTLYELRSAVQLHFRLGARPPRQGGLGRMKMASHPGSEAAA